MTERFNSAVTKLYTAFHNGRLNALDCTACAVGNICDNDRSWMNTTYLYCGDIGLPKRISPEFTSKNKTGYSAEELAIIECLFLYGTRCADEENVFENDSIFPDRDLQFQGLCAVIEYLAELDGIPNPFDFSKLFNEDKQVASSELAVLEA